MSRTWVLCRHVCAMFGMPNVNCFSGNSNPVAVFGASGPPPDQCLAPVCLPGVDETYLFRGNAKPCAIGCCMQLSLEAEL
jgi:hypothetical protein